MKLLLDACTFLWIAEDSPRLSDTARNMVRDPGVEVFLSAVSVWEICVKVQIGTLAISEPVAEFIPKYRALHGFAELPLDEAAVLQVRNLPPLHKDPFDRMLICQAIAHGLAIVTPDAMIARYPVRVIW